MRRCRATGQRQLEIVLQPPRVGAQASGCGRQEHGGDAVQQVRPADRVMADKARLAPVRRAAATARPMKPRPTTSTDGHGVASSRITTGLRSRTASARRPALRPARPRRRSRAASRAAPARRRRRRSAIASRSAVLASSRWATSDFLAAVLQQHPQQVDGRPDAARQHHRLGQRPAARSWAAPWRERTAATTPAALSRSRLTRSSARSSSTDCGRLAATSSSRSSRTIAGAWQVAPLRLALAPGRQRLDDRDEPARRASAASAAARLPRAAGRRAWDRAAPPAPRPPSPSARPARSAPPASRRSPAGG